MIDQIKTFRLRCDDNGCGAETIVHADDEYTAVEEASWAYQQALILCPTHRIY